MTCASAVTEQRSPQPGQAVALSETFFPHSEHLISAIVLSSFSNPPEHDCFKFAKRRQLFIRTHDEPLPSSRCASATKIVRPLESTVATQPQLQPALLRLSAMISQYFTRDSASFALHTAMTKEP
jgi:hypothetical protein